jgi:hypothetical protein
MKALSYQSLTLFLVIIIASPNAQAQTVFPRYEAGIRLSALAYQGDLSPSAIGSYKTPTLGFGAFVTRNMNKAFSIRANLDYQTIRGNDAAYTKPNWRQERNLKFNTAAVELSAHLVYNLKSSYKNYGFAPYIFGGAGISLLHVKRDFSAFNYNFPDWPSWVTTGLADDIQTAPPKSSIVFPVGAGFKHPVSNQLTFFGEAAYRFMFTDYLDGFSRSGDPKDNDHYSNISIGLIWRPGNNGINCPRY